MPVKKMVLVNGNAVHTMIHKRGYSYEEVAIETGYSVTGLYHALNRERIPESKYEALIKLLHVDGETLKKGEEPEPAKKPITEKTDVMAQLERLNEAQAETLKILKAIYAELKG